MTRTLPRSSHAPPDRRVGRGAALRGAACTTLPLPVVDRYFGAHPFREPFAHATARMICAHCPVRLACLTQAIAEERGSTTRDVWNVRGGEAGSTVLALAQQARRERIPAARLAREVLARQVPPLRGAYGSTGLRAGNMPDHVPAFDR